VRANGKWVIRPLRTTVTTYTTRTVTSYEPHSVTSTVANPLYQTLVADASDFHSRQPPPYNAGVCSV
jgi:hypothetical protein